MTFSGKSEREELTLARSDVVDGQVASGPAVGLGQRAQVAVSASVERADGPVPRVDERRRRRHAVGSAAPPSSNEVRPAPRHGATPAATARAAAAGAETVQQRAAVGGADAAWLTVADTTHLAGTAAAATEPVTRRCCAQTLTLHITRIASVDG